MDEKNQRRRERNSKRRKVKIGRVLILILVFLLLCLGIGVFTYYNSQERKIISMDSEKSTLVLDDIMITEYEDKSVVGINEGKRYVLIDVINDYIDEYLYYDESVEKVIYTDLTNTIVFTIGQNEYYFNDEKLEMNLPVMLNEDGKVLVSEDLLLEIYNVKLSYYEDTNINSLETYEPGTTSVKDKHFNYLRIEPTEESDYYAKLQKDDIVYVYSVDDVYAKIKTQNGVVGYIEIEKLNEIDIKENIAEAYEWVAPIEEPIVLLWDQVTTFEANSNASRKILHEGVNVLSPTWFSFDTSLNGNIVSLASQDYVDFAHANGYQVWALLDDFDDTGVGNISSQIVKDYSIRQNAINQIMTLIKQYDLDGINLDFEYVQEDTIDSYIQFVRELYTVMKKEGYILSVDTYVPSAWSMYYDRESLSESCDYIAVMTYDEHTSANEEFGPVASISFVEQGVVDSLEEVSPNKLLMGIPFYTRIWKAEYTDDGANNSLSNFGMTSAVEFFESNNAVIRWDDETGYYYSEFTTTENENEVYYEAWLETIETVEEKLEIFNKYDLAGVALWKRGLEDEAVWPIINEMVNQE